MDTRPLETAYDQSVAPLMEQIYSICEQQGIAFVATFQVDDDEDGTSILIQNCNLPEEGAADILWEMTEMLEVDGEEKPFSLPSMVN